MIPNIERFGVRMRRFRLERLNLVDHLIVNIAFDLVFSTEYVGSYQPVHSLQLRNMLALCFISTVSCPNPQPLRFISILLLA